MMTVEDWGATLRYCGCDSPTAKRWAPLFAKHVQASSFSTGLHEMDDFVGQILHESYWLRRLEENLNYSAARLIQVWPNRFDSIEMAQAFAGSPRDLAEKVYGGRLGNIRPGDGWRFRGQGLIMCTGYVNYKLVTELIGQELSVDFVVNPEMMQDPETALRVAIAWWERKVPDSAMGDIVRVTKAVNGGTHGLEQRASITRRAKERLHD